MNTRGLIILILSNSFQSLSNAVLSNSSKNAKCQLISVKMAIFSKNYNDRPKSMTSGGLMCLCKQLNNNGSYSTQPLKTIKCCFHKGDRNLLLAAGRKIFGSKNFDRISDCES